MARRGVALGVLAALLVAGVWWWAVLRLALIPERTGFVEGAVAAGGWGLSLLPVHVTAARAGTGWVARASATRASVSRANAARTAVTKAAERRRSAR
ncbi:hypothetical protein ABZ348_33755 [Streptomyces sp. NPDC005963]|uniref:hypothetical protein n=1 Tax=Streptomyces sp. NPDC005963 TaxID=3156721 RepID=UPI0033FE96D4